MIVELRIDLKVHLYEVAMINSNFVFFSHSSFNKCQAVMTPRIQRTENTPPLSPHPPPTVYLSGRNYDNLITVSHSNNSSPDADINLCFPSADPISMSHLVCHDCDSACIFVLSSLK